MEQKTSGIKQAPVPPAQQTKPGDQVAPGIERGNERTGETEMAAAIRDLGDKLKGAGAKTASQQGEVAPPTQQMSADKAQEIATSKAESSGRGA